MLFTTLAAPTFITSQANLLAYLEKHSIHLWDLEQGRKLLSSFEHKIGLVSLGTSASHLIKASVDGIVNKNSIFFVLEGPTPPMRSAITMTKSALLSYYGTLLLTNSDEGGVKLWKSDGDGPEVQSFNRIREEVVESARFSVDESLILTSTPHSTCIWKNLASENSP